MATLPQGKGFFTWKLIECEGGNPQAIANTAEAANLEHVLVKLADGTYAYNLSVSLPAICEALLAKGIQVWGWHYIYGVEPAGEASRICTRLRDLPFFTGLIANAEGEFKEPGKDLAAKTYLEGVLNQYPNLSIGLSSYRYPTYHLQFPWSTFFRYVKFIMPQVYWAEAHNPVDQLSRSINEYAARTSLPYIPTGSAYGSSTWKPTPDDILNFLTGVKARGLPAVNFWEWSYTRRNLPDLWSAIAAFPFSNTPPPPPPDEEEPIPDELQDALAAIYAVAVSNQKALASANSKLDNILEIIKTPPVEPPPNQPPPGDEQPEQDVVQFRITEDPRCNARFFEVWDEDDQELKPKRDGAGKPIMMTYPSDTSEASQRVQFTMNSVVQVMLPAETGTGGDKFLRLFKGTDKNGNVWTKGAHGEKLYIPQESGTKITII